MSLELIPILSGFSAVLMLIQPRQTAGWRGIAGVILGCLAIGWLLPPLAIGLTIGSLIWAFFLLLPIQGFAQVERLVRQEQYQSAAQWMDRTRWLHPFDGWWDYPHLLRGLALAQSGQLAAAQQIFHQYPTGQNPITRLATILLHRLNGQWADFVTWVQQQSHSSPVLQDPNVQLMYLRSLGELGQVNELLDALQQCDRALRQAGNPIFLNTARMYALAFCGQPESLAWLFQQHLVGMPADTQQFWQATAYLRSGNHPQAQQIFQTLRQTATPGLNSAIADRLSARSAIPAPLNLPSQHYLGQLQAQMMQEVGNKIQVRPNLRQIPITTTLIGMNVVVHIFLKILPMLIALIAVGLVTAGQFDESALSRINTLLRSIDNLYDLGVLYPAFVAQGEWWRLLTAVFLHGGWFHLLSNMLGLYVLGGIVEPLLGKLRYAIGYFVTGIGSMLAVTVLNNSNLIQESAVVGASGAIMGLLGMMGAIFLVRWLRFKEAIAVQRLKMVGIIALFQTISDNIVPNVSKAGHLSGLTIGFFVGLILVKTITLKRAQNPQSKIAS
jgi:rhomboid protease GluP